MQCSTANPSPDSPTSHNPSSLADPTWTCLTACRSSALLEKYRDTNVQHDWWDFIYEQFVEKLKEIGIEVETGAQQTRSGRVVHHPQIFFSGFWSQGDGACFAGYVSDWPKLLTAMGEERFIQDADSWVFKCCTGGRYCHSGTMGFDGELLLGDNPFDPETQLLQHEAWALTHTSEKERDDLWNRLEAKFRELADELYSDLEAEYDHLTSDEQVVEYILANAPGELIEEDEEAEA